MNKILKVVLIGGAAVYGLQVLRNMQSPKGTYSIEGKRLQLSSRANSRTEADAYYRMSDVEVDNVFDYVYAYTWQDKVGPDGLRVIVNGILAKYGIPPVRI